MRRLLCTRRHVALDRADDYLIAWHALRHNVAEVGGHAWIFRGAGHEDRFLEFIEWDDTNAAPLDHADVAAAFAQLVTFAPAESTDEWEEAT